jgi:CRP-like cAMP-binding protein
MAASDNLILAHPRFAELLAPLEPVTLHRNDVVHEADQLVRHLVFMESGLVSLIRPLRDGKRIPLWTFNPLVIGTAIRYWMPVAVHDAVVQIGGHGWRVPRERILDAMSRDGLFRQAYFGWVTYCDYAIAKSAACQIAHTVEQRFCRLLLVAERAVGSPIALSLSQIAAIMPASPAHVYRVAGALEAAGALVNHRDRIEVRDIAIVRSHACICFDALGERRERSLQPFTER